MTKSVSEEDHAMSECSRTAKIGFLKLLQIQDKVKLFENYQYTLNYTLNYKDSTQI